MKIKKYILGISCFYHDSAAALIRQGEIVCAVQEERFSRKKYDSSFPDQAIKYCLKSQNINLADVENIIYYEKPLLTFERLLETYLGTSPRGLRSFISAMQVWLKEKLFIKSILKKKFLAIQKELNSKNANKIPKILFSEHHYSHAAAAFYPSPFKEAAVLCMDGVGEWATTSGWIGKKNKLIPIWNINFPHSIGLLYSAFTYYCGFKVNSGEYKLMGLAPYGTPKYVDLIKKSLIDIKEDGSFKLNMSFFKYHRGFTMTNNKFNKLFKNKPRTKDERIEKFHMDLAASIQQVIEEIIIKLAWTIKKESGLNNLCLGGGVALNCVANGKLLREKIFDSIWIQPASGDAGSAIGSALIAWHDNLDKSRKVDPNDSMKGSFLGCEFSNEEIISYLKKINASFYELNDYDLFEEIARLLDDGKVIGWFNGRMEFGPRALGGRSIIGDPRNPLMQRRINHKIKFRESFRPFAPSILEEEVSNQFEMDQVSPYMLFVSRLKKQFCFQCSKKEYKHNFGLKNLDTKRSTLPAITHIDYSARIQTVSKKTNPRFYNLINTFKKKTGCPTIVNTSFNVRGEPIVCTPQDAYRCFMRTDMDVLVLENQILHKNKQPFKILNEDWNQEFELD